MNETKFYFKDVSSNQIYHAVDFDSSCQQFVLMHHSKSRICYIDEDTQPAEMKNSNDLVFVKENKIYLKDRCDRQVKIHGKLTNLILLEDVDKMIILISFDFNFN